MPLPLPNLDDRRWSDLVDEARSLIPRLAPGWTDFNVSDPGITLIDLHAMHTEADVFGIDRIPRSHRRQFLALAGISLRPVLPTVTPVQFMLSAAMSEPIRIPTGVVLRATTDGGDTVQHQLRVSEGGSAPHIAVSVLGCALKSVQVWTGSQYVDRTQDWRLGSVFDALGPDPAAIPHDDDAAALLLGFDPACALRAGDRLSLWLTLDDSATAGLDVRADEPLATPSAAVAWEFFNGTRWQPFGTVVIDETRALTKSGRVVLPVADLAAAGASVGRVTVPRRWVRARIARGRHDVAPRVGAVLADAAPVVQAVPCRAAWQLDPGHPPLPGSFAVGSHVPFGVHTEYHGRIVGFPDARPDDPTALVLGLPTGARDTVTLTLARGGIADGGPSFAATVPGAPFSSSGLAVWTSDDQGATPWTIVDNLLRSGPADRHVVLETHTGTVLFGDGVNGRIPPARSVVLVRAERTAGADGTASLRSQWAVDTGDEITLAMTTLAPSPQPPLGSLAVRAVRGTAGRPADTLEVGEGRAAEQVWTHERLIEIAGTPGATLDQRDREQVMTRSRPRRAATTVDFERIALEVPGTSVLRARAWAGLDPANPGLSAPGTVSLVVVPGLPARRPRPTPTALASIRSYLCPRRSLGTRLVVAGPDYVEVSVTATVSAVPNVDPDRVRTDALTRLYGYLHPLTGGPAGRGWPFGRDVFQAEILRQLDLVDGLDHVKAIELSAGGRVAGCANVCVGVMQLVVSGAHEVTVR